MKSIKKHLALLTLLACISVPQETKPSGWIQVPSTFEYVGLLTFLPALCFSLVYCSYKFFTRNSSVSTLVEFQEDIELYTITVKIRQRRKMVATHVFSGPNAIKVIEEAFTFTQNQQVPHIKKSLKTLFTSQSLSPAKKATFEQQVKLCGDDTLYGLPSSVIRLITPTTKAELKRWKNVRKTLTKRFTV